MTFSVFDYPLNYYYNHYAVDYAVVHAFVVMVIDSPEVQESETAYKYMS